MIHHLTCCSLTCALLLFNGSALLAQVVRDGSIGPGPSVQPAGPAFDITPAMGEASGKNLFHSFSELNIHSPESVTFAAGSGIENIFARVTGGRSSFINGRITAPGNLFLINSYGLMFGSRAELNVAGSFVAGTADYVGFDQNQRFFSSPEASSILSVASPREFGFLTDSPAGMTLTGTYLLAPNLSFIGGSMTLRDSVVGSRLEPLAGGISVVAVGSPGTVGFAGSTAVTTNGFNRFGEITMSSSDFVATTPVVIRAGNVVMTGTAEISSGTHVDLDVNRLDLTGSTAIQNFAGFQPGAGDISIVAREAVNIEGNFFGAGIFAPSSASSGARAVRISTPALTITSGYIDTSVLGALRGSDIILNVGRFHLSGGGYLRTSPTAGTGSGGSISIRASDSFELSGDSNINTGTSTSGNPGNVRIEARTIRISDGGNITSGAFSTSTSPTGLGGNVALEASDSIEITGSTTPDFTGIRSTAFTNARAGDIDIRAPRITVANGAQLAANTLSSGDAGVIRLKADQLIVTNFGEINGGTSGISSGRGGELHIDAGTITVDEFGSISTRTAGRGDAGNITLDANVVTLGLFGRILSNTASGSSGDAGNVTIHANQFRSLPSSFLATQSSAGSGGKIHLDVRQWIEAVRSEISTSVLDGAGGGGDILITMGNVSDVAVMILDKSRLTARAVGGPGGNMRIQTDLFIASAPPGTTISAASERSIDGEIQIDAPDASIVGTVTTLPAEFLDAAGLIREGCVTRRPVSAASLIVQGRGGLPPSPSGLLPGSAADDRGPGRTHGPEYRGALVGVVGDGRPVLLTVRCNHGGW